MKKTVLIASVAAFGLAAPVFAQDTTFADADTDMSGGLSLAEVQAIAPDVTSDGFDAYDADADGELNEDEFETWQMANPGDDSESETDDTESEPYNG
jgi:hypothetical protein